MGQKRVGEQTLRAGQTGEGSIAPTGEEVVSQVHAGLYEQNRRGNIYMGATAVSGVAPGTAIGTTAGFALFNPLNSGFDLVVIKASMLYLSGTLGIPMVNIIYYIAAVQARLFGTQPPLLATSVLTPWRLDDDVNGALIVPPGAAVSLQATAAAGTSPLVIYGCTWGEGPG